MAANPAFVEIPQTVITNFNPATGATQTCYQAGPRGARIYAIAATQTDTSTSNAQLYLGDVLTENSLGFVNYDRNSLAKRSVFTDLRLTNTTNATITRVAGSFKADGWLIRDFVFTDLTNGNPLNQVIQQITSAVAEQTLTFTGTGFNAADAAPGGAVRLIRVQEWMLKALVSQAGNSSTAPVVFFSNTNLPYIPSLPDTAMYLPPYKCIVVTMPTVAAGKQMSVQVFGGDL